MSYPPPPSGQPTSFRTNVNRAKTKRWVEAKSYSYDGGDWGEVDDFDEYGGYDEPQNPPKPTGLRQRGQSATHPIPAARDGRTEDHQPADDGRSGHGNVGGQPVAQHHQGLRSTTDPQPRINTSLARSNSFDRGDEKRDFSAGGYLESVTSSGGGHYQAPSFHQGKTQPPPSQQRPKQGLSSQQGPYQQPLSQQDPYHAPASQRGLLQTSKIPPTITDEQQLQSPAQFKTDQRQNQPELGRLPLHIESQPNVDPEPRHVQHARSQTPNYGGVSYSDQPRQSSLGSRTQSLTSNDSSLDFQNRRDFSPSAIPPPLQTQEAQSSARFPPRKSSLSQMNPPNIANPNQVAQSSPPTTSSDDPSASKDSTDDNDVGKPRPFVRPADIYKRMQEEKEKERERQSQDSSRPGVDALSERSTEGAVFSAQSTAGPNSSAGPGNGPVRTNVNNINASESSQNPRKPLDSVAELKSEYSLDGAPVDQTRDVKQTDSSSDGYHNILRPVLPDVTRMSGFGDLLIATAPSSENQLYTVQDDELVSSPQQNPHAPSQDTTGTSLQHQHSAGFRSVVHQAFDNVQDQIPATPSSASGSGIGRSTSGGTSVISPIISRGPSVAKRSETAKDSETRALTPPPLTLEDVESSSGRPLSSSTLGTPKQIVRKPSPSTVPTTFIPGHRRDLSTPSPDNSPARTPILEPNRQLRKPQEVELAIATPTESAFPSMQESYGQKSSFADSQSTSSNLVAGQNSQQITDHSPAVRDRLINVGASKGTDASKSSRDDSATGTPVTFRDGSTHSRAESPSKNRVRDLAGKFESGSPTRRGSDLSNGLPGVNTPRKDSIPQSRPLADRLESFRPQLPGGWESFSSTAPARDSSKQDNSSEVDRVERIVFTNTLDQPKESSLTPGTARVARAESPSKIPTSLDHSSPNPEPAQPANNPFTAVAAAGSALAGAIFATVGGDKKDLPTSHPKEPQHGSSSDDLASTRSPTASVNTTVYPDASAPLMPPPVDEDSSESTMPLRKDSLQTSNEEQANLTKAEPKVASQDDTLKEPNSVEEDAHPNPQSMLPPLSTNIRDHQYESDRLRREIVKNLSPRGVSEPTTAESESPWQDDSRLSTAPSLVAGPHDSMTIPSEYESYWNGSNSGGEGSRTNSGYGKLEQTLDTAQQRTESIKAPPPLRLSTAYPNAGAEDTTKSTEPPPRPDLQQHPYSWEKGPGGVQTHEPNAIEATATNLSSIPYTASDENNKYMGETPISYTMSHDNNQYMGETPVSPLSQNRGPDNSNLGSRSVRMVTEDSAEDKEQAFKSEVPHSLFPRDRPEKAPLDQDQNSGPQQNFAPLDETNLPRYTSGLPISEPALPLPQNRSSVDGSFDTQVNRTGFQSTAQPQPEYWESTPQMAQSISEFTNQDTMVSPSPPLLSAQQKMPAFREILAMKSSAERIQAFNETREQIAHVNTGLTHWLSVTSRDLPEDSTILSGAERPIQTVVLQKPMPFKAKIPGLRSAGSQATQQPYYQQYLNATPQATSSEGIGGQNAAGSSSSQGFSPSGGSSGKLSTQQVQAKGKDLLQAAGVFGGRANVAAKGLFSKGRSKLRGSSSVDKVDK